MKLSLIALIALVVGFFIGKMNHQPAAPVTPTYNSQQWAETGLQKIQQETDPAQQLAAAEAYYGKAVVLFLASLVNRTQQLPPAPAVAEVAENPAMLAEPVLKELPEKALNPLGNVPVSKKEQKNQEEKNTNEINLARMMEFRKTQPFEKSAPQIRRLQGHYTGVFHRMAGRVKGRVDKLEASFDFSIKEGKLEGNYSIVLTDPEGKAYSNSNGNGSNQTFKPFPGDSNKVYMEPAPGDFIILNISNSDYFRGPYYDSGGTFLGRVEMQRR